MTRKIIMGALALFMIAGFGAAAGAQDGTAIETYHLDKPHTQVMFGIPHMGFSTSYGKFLDYEGTIVLNRGEPEKSSADVTIFTKSITLGDEKWDAHMKNEDFFNVEKFPAMTFKSTHVELTGEDTANLTGDLTLLGVTKPVTLAVTHTKSGKHPMKDVKGAGFEAHGTLKRSDFGMGYGLPMVGDEVELIISVEAYEDDPAAQGTKNE